MVMITLKTVGRREARNPLRVWLSLSSRSGVVSLLFLASACVSPIVQNAPGALRTAEARAKFELNCADVQATVLSQKVVQGLRTEGSEHTIGVRGCGKEAVYVTYCRDVNDCNALSQTGRINPVGEAAPAAAP